MVNILRWIVTAAVLALVGVTAAASGRRLMADLERSRADARFAAGDLAGALAAYDVALGLDPYNSVAHTDAGDTAAYALAYRVEPLGSQPEMAPALALQGVRRFLQAVAGAPPAPWSWAGVARIYEDLRTYRLLIEEQDLSRLGTDPLENLLPEDRLAEAALLQALRYEPTNYFFLDSLGELYWRRGLRDRALAPFRRAVSIHPILERHYYVRERASQSEALATALQEGLDAALEQASLRDRWVVHRELGHLARLRGRQEEAGGHFRRAIDGALAASQRDVASLHLYLAESHQWAGRIEEAVTSLRSAIQLQPERATYHGTLAGLLGRLDRHEEMLAALKAARVLAPSDPHLVRMQAEACRRVGDLDRAERAYQELIRLEPGKVDHYLQVIGLFREQKWYARAIPYARELVRLHPDEPVYRQQLNQLYEDEVRR